MSLDAFPSLREPLQEFMTAVAGHFGDRLVEVRLFGSYARGEAGPDSDVDVAVVVEDPLSHADRVWPMGFAGELVVRHNVVIAPLVLAKSELNLLRQREDLLAQNLANEGVLL